MTRPFQPEVAVVDFNHARGPEIEFWVAESGQKLYDQNDWSLLPFMALSDGVHALVEDFSYFTLLRQPERDGLNAKGSAGQAKTEDKAATPQDGASSLFGIACTRQIRSDRLKTRLPEQTRSTVQKSVVVIVDGVAGLGELRTRLGMVTEMWFGKSSAEIHALILTAYSPRRLHRYNNTQRIPRKPSPHFCSRQPWRAILRLVSTRGHPRIPTANSGPGQMSASTAEDALLLVEV